MVRVLGVVAALAGGLGVATAARAAPVGPSALDLVGGGAVVQQVADGCGPGFHANPWGRCRPNGGYGYGYGYGGYGGPPREYVERRVYREERPYGSYERPPARFYGGY